MNAAEIRQSFLDFFATRGHEVRPSSSLVPADDPTLLFTNAGMVQFKALFLGNEELKCKRAVTSQKCVRAGGKHNDLEEVGRTARHHTFFEMLGNFSFGDYFKREAIRYGWEFLTDELGLERDRLFVTVHHSDDEAAKLWTEVAGVPGERIYRLGDKDNFWQMADTGPCGPCSEVHYDVRQEGERGTELSVADFEAKGEAGEFLELWNLVFMQFDRDAEGTLTPLPAPSIDTGAGLERLAAVLQGVDSNYHTDLFLPLLEIVAGVVGAAYEPNSERGLSYRVLADHARAVTFLLADGVFPSNEGRGYVLRRILRRGVRHAWLLGQREPTLVDVAAGVISGMGKAYPELPAQRDHILTAVRREEERFLGTIDDGMERLTVVAPPVGDRSSFSPVISGEEVFKLYDTFGFPPDLTRLMARERGYEVDMAGFETALAAQRERSRISVGSGIHTSFGVNLTLDNWDCLLATPDKMPEQRYVAREQREVKTQVIGFKAGAADRTELILMDHPFYEESGGQVSDQGRVFCASWALEVETVERRSDSWLVVGGPTTGEFPGGEVVGSKVSAQVAASVRNDTERNHTGTHLLHAALRSELGLHVVQRGSLVAPDRLRFDFAHTEPVTDAEVRKIENRVNEMIWANHPVEIGGRPYKEAVKAGAMALFGEKYGEMVRVVEISDVSMELCGGTHVGYTGEIGLFAVISESGVAAGVRRLEAVTGRGAVRYLESYKKRVEKIAVSMKSAPDNLERRVEQLRAEKRTLEALVDDLLRTGSDGSELLVEESIDFGGRVTLYKGLRLKARNAGDVRTWGDSFRASGEVEVAVVAAELPDEKYALFAFATDSAVSTGLRADVLVREVAAAAGGGGGGGRPHMAQAGLADPTRTEEALRAGVDVVRRWATVD